MTSAETLALIRDHKRPLREKGLAQLSEAIQLSKTDSVWHDQAIFEEGILLLLMKTHWEPLHGALNAAKLIILNANAPSDAFRMNVLNAAAKLLGYNESRVRTAAGETIGALCTRFGVKIYEDHVKDVVLDKIRENLVRDADNLILTPESQVLIKKLITDHENDEAHHEHEHGSEHSHENCNHSHNHGEPQKAAQEDAKSIMSSSSASSLTAEQIFHDTAGWKCLETSITCLAEIIRGCGPAFLPHLTEELLDLIYQALCHINRFVRESCCTICGIIVDCFTSSTVDGVLNQLVAISLDMAQRIGYGLADEWSEVRMAASIAARKLLLALTREQQEPLFPMLLPRLCLNRHYVADGLKIYSHETWMLVVKDQGTKLLAKYIDVTVAYYTNQAQSDNQELREAACWCIRELVSRIDKEAVRPFVSELLDSVLLCYIDESWPVRDVACQAVGAIALNFPEETRPQRQRIFDLFLKHLADNVPTVRYNTALALADLIRVYDDAYPIVFNYVRENIGQAKQQPNDSSSMTDLSNEYDFAQVKRDRDNDVALHSNQVVYSCCSLGPKMKRAMNSFEDTSFQRPPHPYEISDGCVAMLAQLVKIRPSGTEELLKKVADISYCRNFTMHFNLLTTIWNQLLIIINYMDKKIFKRYLDLFFDALFYSLQSKNQLCAEAAAQLLRELQTHKHAGPTILRGRVESYDPSHLALYDRVVQQQQPQHL